MIFNKIEIDYNKIENLLKRKLQVQENHDIINT